MADFHGADPGDDGPQMREPLEDLDVAPASTPEDPVDVHLEVNGGAGCWCCCTDPESEEQPFDAIAHHGETGGGTAPGAPLPESIIMEPTNLDVMQGGQEGVIRPVGPLPMEVTEGLAVQDAPEAVALVQEVESRTRTSWQLFRAAQATGGPVPVEPAARSTEGEAQVTGSAEELKKVYFQQFQQQKERAMALADKEGSYNAQDLIHSPVIATGLEVPFIVENAAELDHLVLDAVMATYSEPLDYSRFSKVDGRDDSRFVFTDTPILNALCVAARGTWSEDNWWSNVQYEQVALNANLRNDQLAVPAFYDKIDCTGTFESEREGGLVSEEVSKTKQHEVEDDVWVHKGFLMLYLNSRDQVVEYVKQQCRTNCSTIIVSGHSMGGALATLLALDLACRTEFDQFRIITATFGSPAIGCKNFAAFCQKRVHKTVRFIVAGDLVPRVLGFAPSHASVRQPYCHVVRATALQSSMQAGLAFLYNAIMEHFQEQSGWDRLARMIQTATVDFHSMNCYADRVRAHYKPKHSFAVHVQALKGLMWRFVAENEPALGGLAGGFKGSIIPNPRALIAMKHITTPIPSMGQIVPLVSNVVTSIPTWYMLWSLKGQQARFHAETASSLARLRDDVNEVGKQTRRLLQLHDALHRELQSIRTQLAENALREVSREQQEFDKFRGEMEAFLKHVPESLQEIRKRPLEWQRSEGFGEVRQKADHYKLSFLRVAEGITSRMVLNSTSSSFHSNQISKCHDYLHIALRMAGVTLCVQTLRNPELADVVNLVGDESSQLSSAIGDFIWRTKDHSPEMSQGLSLSLRNLFLISENTMTALPNSSDYASGGEAAALEDAFSPTPGEVSTAWHLAAEAATDLMEFKRCLHSALAFDPTSRQIHFALGVRFPLLCKLGCRLQGEQGDGARNDRMNLLFPALKVLHARADPDFFIGADDSGSMFDLVESLKSYVETEESFCEEAKCVERKQTEWLMKFSVLILSALRDIETIDDLLEIDVVNLHKLLLSWRRRMSSIEESEANHTLPYAPAQVQCFRDWLQPSFQHMPLQDQITLEIARDHHLIAEKVKQEKSLPEEDRSWTGLADQIAAEYGFTRSVHSNVASEPETCVSDLVQKTREQCRNMLQEVGKLNNDGKQKMEADLEAVSELANNRKLTLFIAGQTSSGKTSLINTVLLSGLRDFPTEVDVAREQSQRHRDILTKLEDSRVQVSDIAQETRAFVSSQLWSSDKLSDSENSAIRKYGFRTLWSDRGLIETFNEENTIASTVLEVSPDVVENKIKLQSITVEDTRTIEETFEESGCSVQQMKGLLLKGSDKSAQSQSEHRRHTLTANFKYSPRLGRPLAIFDNPGTSGSAGAKLGVRVESNITRRPFLLVIVAPLYGDCIVDRTLLETLQKLETDELSPPLPPLVVFTKWDVWEQAWLAACQIGDDAARRDLEGALKKKLEQVLQTLHETVCQGQDGAGRGGPMMAATNCPALLKGDSTWEDQTSMVHFWLKIEEILQLCLDGACANSAAQRLFNIMKVSLKTAGFSVENIEQRKALEIFTEVTAQAKERFRTKLEKVLPRGIYESKNKWPKTFEDCAEKWSKYPDDSPLNKLSQKVLSIAAKHKGGSMRSKDSYVKSILNDMYEQWHTLMREVAAKVVEEIWAWIDHTLKERAESMQALGGEAGLPTESSNYLGAGAAGVLGGGAAMGGIVYALATAAQAAAAAEAAAAAASWSVYFGLASAPAAPSLAVGALTATGAMMGAAMGGTVVVGTYAFYRVGTNYVTWTYAKADEEILALFREKCFSNLFEEDDGYVEKLSKDFNDTIARFEEELEARCTASGIGGGADDFLSTMNEVLALRNKTASGVKFQSGPAWLFAPERLREFAETKCQNPSVPKRLWWPRPVGARPARAEELSPSDISVSDSQDAVTEPEDAELYS